jgi:Uri superfamily endonuclease
MAPITKSPFALYLNEGTYVLIIELKSHTRLTVGKLGRFDFPAGWYAYAGSAFGPGGLRARLSHHLRGASRPHWHVDYLGLKGYIQEIWYGRGTDYDEHRWTARLRSLPHADVLVPGFGSSDCRCETHLVYFPLRPDINRFRREQPRAADAVARPPIYRRVTGI